MKRTPEWYEAYQKRVARHVDTERPTNAQIAAQWNGNVQPCRDVGAATRKGAVGASHSALSARPSATLLYLYPLVNLCRAVKIAEPVPEYRFHTRRWRFDYAWPLHMLAMEIDGGVWTQGRHSRGAGKIADMEKLSEAAILGWRVLYAVPDDLKNGLALDRVMRALTDRAAA